MIRTQTRFILSILAFAALAALVPQTARANCNNLTVTIEVPDLTELVQTCTHGQVVAATPTTVVLTNIGYYGPDCRFAFFDGHGALISIYDVQQNFCALEAGDITVTKVSGKTLKYKKIPGSYAQGRGGEVDIQGVE